MDKLNLEEISRSDSSQINGGLVLFEEIFKIKLFYIHQYSYFN